MNKRQYKLYLKGEHWQAYRLEVLGFWENRCALCYSIEQVEVHHRTYKRLGREKITDCLPLCNRCHNLHTNFAGNFLAEVWGGMRQ